MGKRHDKIYTESLKDQQEGIAVYVKLLANDVKPGTVGYVNSDGNWHTVLQLTDAKALKDHRFDDLTVTGKEEGGKTHWRTPKTSANITGRAVSLDAKVLPPGAPAGANAGWEFRNTSQHGAVLMTFGPITTLQLTNILDMRHWMNKHVESVVKLSDYETIAKRGLWVITRTYSAPRRRIAVLQATDSRYKIHTGVKATSDAQVQGSAEWWNSDQSDSGWIEDRITSAEEKGVVLFVTGVWWKPSGFFTTGYRAVEERKKQDFLDAGDESQAVYVDKPGSGNAEPSSKTVLKLIPGGVGTGEGFDHLAPYSDFSALFPDSDDSDYSDED